VRFKFARRNRRVTIALTMVVLLQVAGPHASESADFGGYRPHYQGYGVNTPGGRGGAILRVTNLNDSGPGSLRAALEATGPRFVIFETSGTVGLKTPIFITSPFVTIAGQTAPSPGINIRNFGIYVDTHDVVIQHIRIREGDTSQSTPGNYFSLAVGTNGAHDVVIDHVSIGWAMYMGFAALNYMGGTPHPTRVALLDSLIAYSLSKNYIYTGYGAGMGHQGCMVSTCEYTYARNLFVHTSYRQPILGVGRVNLVNNVVYGSGPWSTTDDQWAFMMYWQNQSEPDNAWVNRNPWLGSQAAIVNTLAIPSTGTGQGATAGSGVGQKSFSFDFALNNVQNQDTKVWLSGNRGPGITGPTGQGQKDGISWVTSRGGADFSKADIWYASEPSWYSAMNFTTIPADNVADYVFAQAGARPLDRDSLDVTAVAHAKAGLVGDIANMGSRVTSPTEMGGQITLAQNVRPLQVPANPHAVAPGQTFRTNIEVWLESMARALEPGSAVPSAPKAALPSPPTALRFVRN
jgi:pectate lyase